MFFWNESSLCVWKKTSCSPSFMPKLFIALELRLDTGNLSKIEEAIKEGFEVNRMGILFGFLEVVVGS